MRVCSGAGCLRAVPDDVRYCDECVPVASNHDETRTHTSGYDAELDALRKGTRWQRLRRRVIQEQPLCARCALRLSEIVDHIVPALVALRQAQDSGRYPLDKSAGYYLRSNLQGLCRPCHGDKTNEDKAHIGPWEDVVTKELMAVRRKWSFA
jgi:5-methylcytosine-specific restriction endonuclease McrA